MYNTLGGYYAQNYQTPNTSSIINNFGAYSQTSSIIPQANYGQIGDQTQIGYFAQNYQPQNTLNIINNYVGSYSPTSYIMPQANYGQTGYSVNPSLMVQSLIQSMMSIMMNSMISSMFNTSNSTTTSNLPANTNSTNIFNIILNFIPDIFNFESNTPWDWSSDDGGSSSASGDPHFYNDGQHVFDFMGHGGEEYTLLENRDVKLSSTFNGGQNTATTLGDETLLIKDPNSNPNDPTIKLRIEYHPGGAYEVYDAEDNQLSGDELQTALDEAGVTLTQNGSNLKVDYDFDKENEGVERTITMGSANVSDVSILTDGNTENSRYDGDSGLLAQTSDVRLEKTQGNENLFHTEDNAAFDSSKIIHDIDGDGEKDIDWDALYESGLNIMAKTDIMADNSSLDTTNPIIAAIEEDIKAGRYDPNAEHGGVQYTSRHWNEYVGRNLFLVEEAN